MRCSITMQRGDNRSVTADRARETPHAPSDKVQLPRLPGMSGQVGVPDRRITPEPAEGRRPLIGEEQRGPLLTP